MRYTPAMDDTDFFYQQEEVTCTLDGNKRSADITWEGVVSWEYDSGDWSVGIRDGFIGRVEHAEVTKVSLWDEDAELLVAATPEQFAQVAKQAKLDHERVIDELS